MTSSQKQFDTDLKEAKETAAPVDLVNIMLEYADYDHESGRGEVPLVSTLFNSIKTQKSVRLKKLLTAIVSGNPDEARALLDKDPSLVLDQLEEKEVVIAPTGHQFNLKPYQAALSVDDTQMAELIKSYFKDEKEADRQYEEQCPEGWMDAEQKKWQPLFEQLNKLTLTIRGSKDDLKSSGEPDYVVTMKKGSNVEKELHAFWRLLDSTRNEVVTAGKKPFNHHLLLEAWRTYDDAKLFKDYFGGHWEDPRALLFWQKVIGYDGIQRIMPVNYVQVFHEWLEDTVKKLQNGEPQGRSTRFEFFRAGNLVLVDFYPLQERQTEGFNFGIYGRGAARAAALASWPRAAPPGRQAFRSLCQSKTAVLQNLYRSTKTIDLNH